METSSIHQQTNNYSPQHMATMNSPSSAPDHDDEVQRTLAQASPTSVPKDPIIDAPQDPSLRPPTLHSFDESGGPPRFVPRVEPPSRPFRIKDLMQHINDGLRDEVAVPIQSAPRIQRPGNQTYFRCHGCESTWPVFVVFIPEGEFNECYFVAPNMTDQLSRVTRRVRLVPCITLEGVIFFWPLNVSDSSNSWNDSARVIAGKATKQWIRMESSKHRKEYAACTPIHPKAEPNWPKQDALDDLLEMATGGKIIDSVEHPAVAKLF